MTTLAAPPAVQRRRLEVAGAVQWVGFHPFVHRLAAELGLAGHVGRDTDGAWVEVEGEPAALDAFSRHLVEDAPPLARLDAVRTVPLVPIGEEGFSEAPGRDDGDGRPLVAPDVAVCGDCLAELFDRRSRRYRHPFIDCANCGPRFSVTVCLPADRPNTTMAGFPMCPACAAEHADPADRRFRAPSIACPACGPRLWFDGGTFGPHPEGDRALAAAQRLLAEGKVVAVKGIGGYHLACDATNPRAVELLRRRTGRGDRPVAVMVPTLSAARRLASIGAAEAALLTGPERPIVLVRRRAAGSCVADAAAPGSPRLGLLLPDSPLHHLLLRPVPGARQPAPRALVITSGNCAGEPIAHRDDDARRRLAGLADGWLVHDRPIHVPCDDSVVQVVGGEAQVVRRSRGHAPLPVRLPFEAPPVVAAGADVGNTFCLASGRDAWLSQHQGDMGGLETMAAFERSVRQLAGLHRVVPEAVAADLHPGYVTRRWAERRTAATGERLELVQHEHAHVAAVMAEHGLAPESRVLGVAFDGTGWGVDGAIWGGELLVAGYDEAERVAHLRGVPLPGGDAAVRNPYRMALSHLRAAGIGWAPDLAPVAVAGPELSFFRRQLETGAGCVTTTSVGRLVDAVSALLGLCQVASSHTEAAVRLEAAAERAPSRGPRYRFAGTDHELDPRPVVAAVVADLRAGVPVPVIALAFHRALALATAALAERHCRRAGCGTVVLSGDVFQNGLLVRLVRRPLAARGLEVLTPRLVPPNDGGLALGQAVVVAARLAGAPSL